MRDPEQVNGLPLTGDLRIPGKGRGRQIRIVVDGRAYSAFEGETVHAALMAAGIRVLRRSRKTGQPKGGFCGMGICYECRVTIDRVRDCRACMTLVRDGMEILTQEEGA